MLPKGYLIGNFTADPVPGITNTSMDYSRFSIACSDNYTRANQSAKTHFFNCIAWGKRAQYISTYLKKGDSVFIEYTLSTSSYTNTEGRIIRRVDLQVDNVQPLFQKLNKSLDSSNATESYVEDKDILQDQNNNLSSTFQESKSNESTDDLDLSEIYKSFNN